MKANIILISILGLYLFSSCQKRNMISDQKIDSSTKFLSTSKILFSKDKHSYFYDLKISDHVYIFFDNKEDTAIWLFKNDVFKEPITTIERSLDPDKAWRPLATKNILTSTNNADKILFIDNNSHCKKLELDRLNDTITISIFNPDIQIRTYSTDFNLTTKYLYAIPINRKNKNPFYFFNPDSGYYWVDPSPTIAKKMPEDILSYTNTICLNEKMNTVVSAYRFTNYISFYGLDGVLKKTFLFGKNPIIPTIYPRQNEIDIKNTLKCFVYICGTPQYVYCLYDGSTHFTNHSKIVVFKWDGKHVATWQADRNLRAIAVDKEDKYILAISSNENGQDIIKYDLE